MIADPDEIELSIEDRIIKAMEKEYNKRSPLQRSSPDFPAMTRHYIKLAMAIATTNTVEQIIEFVKTAHLIQNEISIPLLLDYLNKTVFLYHPIQHKSQGRFKNDKIKNN